MINTISSLIIPLMVMIIIGYGMLKKVDIYDEFIEGSKESFGMIKSMFPCLLAMILGINIFIKSNVLEIIFNFLMPILKIIKIPIETLPMMIMRPISGSASLAMLNSILGDYGPDSFIGRLASVIQGSTDTTFYILTLYFGSIGIKKIRYSLWVGLCADVVGIIMAIISVNVFFN